MLDSLLHYQIDLAFAILRMIPEFTKMGRFYSARAALNHVREMFLHVPDLYLFDSPACEDKPDNKNEERLRTLLCQLQVAAAKEASFLQGMLENEVMAGHCLNEIHARLSLMLHENAPLARPHEDNCLVDMDIPLCYLGLGGKNFPDGCCVLEAFADYVLCSSVPRLNASRLEHLASIWLDLDLSQYIGRTLDDASERLGRDELARLVSWPQKVLERGINTAPPDPLEQAEGGFHTIDTLLRRLKQLKEALDYGLPENLLRMYFAAFLDCLNAARRDISNWRQNPMQNHGHATSDTECVKNLKRLDKVMRLYELDVQYLIRETNYIVKVAGPETDLFMRDDNPVGIGDCTLWTRRNGFLSGLFMGLPLISIPYVSGDLIGSGDDWSETSAISGMRYLTHIFAHDSHLPWHDLGYADYVTIRVDSSRQLYRNFSDGI